jgi:hypothetical protein
MSEGWREWIKFHTIASFHVTQSKNHVTTHDSWWMQSTLGNAASKNGRKGLRNVCFCSRKAWLSSRFWFQFLFDIPFRGTTWSLKMFRNEANISYFPKKGKNWIFFKKRIRIFFEKFGQKVTDSHIYIKISQNFRLRDNESQLLITVEKLVVISCSLKEPKL